jgi:hypothetical protein
MGMVETYLYRGLAKEMVMAGRGGQFLVPHTGSNFTLFTAVTVSIVVFVCYIFMDGTDLVHIPSENAEYFRPLRRQIKSYVRHFGTILKLLVFDWLRVDR